MRLPLLCLCCFFGVFAPEIGVQVNLPENPCSVSSNSNDPVVSDSSNSTALDKNTTLADVLSLNHISVALHNFIGNEIAIIKNTNKYNRIYYSNCASDQILKNQYKIFIINMMKIVSNNSIYRKTVSEQVVFANNDTKKNPLYFLENGNISTFPNIKQVFKDTHPGEVEEPTSENILTFSNVLIKTPKDLSWLYSIILEPYFIMNNESHRAMMVISHEKFVFNIVLAS